MWLFAIYIIIAFISLIIDCKALYIIITLLFTGFLFYKEYCLKKQIKLHKENKEEL